MTARPFPAASWPPASHPLHALPALPAGPAPRAAPPSIRFVTPEAIDPPLTKRAFRGIVSVPQAAFRFGRARLAHTQHRTDLRGARQEARW